MKNDHLKRTFQIALDLEDVDTLIYQYFYLFWKAATRNSPREKRMVAMMIVDAKTFEVDTVSGSSGYRIETSPQKKPSLVVGKNLTMKVMTTRKTALAAVKTGEKRVTKRPPSMQLQQQLTPLPLDLFHVGSGMVTNAIFFPLLVD